jgi:hypothetical protein
MSKKEIKTVRSTENELRALYIVRNKMAKELRDKGLTKDKIWSELEYIQDYINILVNRPQIYFKLKEDKLINQKVLDGLNGLTDNEREFCKNGLKLVHEQEQDKEKKDKQLVEYAIFLKDYVVRNQSFTNTV